jgi:hypothetical protein
VVYLKRREEKNEEESKKKLNPLAALQISKET